MIALQISTITKEEQDRPSTAYKIDYSDDLPKAEIEQFYTYLRHCVRHIEGLIDELITEDE